MTKQMKRIFFMMMAMAVAVQAAATDRFHIEDFTISPGQTRTVSIELDNEAQYTAFQCDLYLPQGLTATNYALTARKSSNHTFSATDAGNGGVRLLSYSIRLNPYSGNSGPLVTLDVTASDGFTGPATIALRGTLFTTIDGVEVALADETCTVTAAASAKPGDANSDGHVDVADVSAVIYHILGKPVGEVNTTNADMNGDGALDVSDVASIIALILGK